MVELDCNFYTSAYKRILALTGSPVKAKMYADSLFDFWYLEDARFKFNTLKVT